MLTNWQLPNHKIPAADPRPLFAREPVVDLAGARVAIVGCGSVGSLAAWALASAGVRQLALIDRDTLVADNLRRHACGAADLARPKAQALADLLRAHFPEATVRTIVADVLERPATCREWVAWADVLLVAVDREAPKHLLELQARELSRPAVYAGVYGGGWGAEVVFADSPGPCYACCARALGRAGVETEPESHAPGYVLSRPGTESSAWMSADLTSILPCASLAARVATAWLGSRQGAGGPWEELRRPGVSAWRLALRHVPAWEAGPWQLLPVSIPPRPNCPNCTAPQAANAEVAAWLEGLGHAG
jgi:molybdopterin/thiamine biosynthesis adenylyltransferase